MQDSALEPGPTQESGDALHMALCMASSPATHAWPTAVPSRAHLGKDQVLNTAAICTPSGTSRPLCCFYLTDCSVPGSCPPRNLHDSRGVLRPVLSGVCSAPCGLPPRPWPAAGLDEAQPQAPQQDRQGQKQCAPAADLHTSPSGHQGGPVGAQLPGSTGAPQYQSGGHSHSASGGGQHHTSLGGGSGGLHSFYAAEQPPEEGGTQQEHQLQAAAMLSSGVGGEVGGGGGGLAGLHFVVWPISHGSVLIKRAQECGMVSQALLTALPAVALHRGQASLWHTFCTEHGFDPQSAVLQLWLCSTAP